MLRCYGIVVIVISSIYSLLTSLDGGYAYAYACGCVLAYADKRLTIFNTYAHPTDQPIAHLRGQHPMTASEPPAKWGADSRAIIISSTRSCLTTVPSVLLTAVMPPPSSLISRSLMETTLCQRLKARCHYISSSSSIVVVAVITPLLL